MIKEQREIEVKFPITDISKLEDKIKSLQLPIIQASSHEVNLRFDTSDHQLSAEHIVLRLRQDGKNNILTYKAPVHNGNQVAIREEIETFFDNFNNMQSILEKIGFEVFFIYEKIRAVYQLGQTLLMLDHTPIGDFLEIEGNGEESIKESASILGIDWQSGTSKSYQKLFEEWKEQSGCTKRDMCFE